MLPLMEFCSRNLRNPCKLKNLVIIQWTDDLQQKRSFLKRLRLIKDTITNTDTKRNDDDENKSKVNEEDDERKTTAIFSDDIDPEETFIRPVQLNRSGLRDQHRNLLHEMMPYRQPQSWIHLTEKYQRKQYGRYGIASGIDPRICFPTHTQRVKDELFQKNYVEPQTLPDMMEMAKKKRQLEMETKRKREEDIAKKILNLEQWKRELQMKIAKREAEAVAAKERKERLVEEVRRHFGYKIDPRDERFKEVLEQKEKEEKKRLKEEKRKAKDVKSMAKIIAYNQANTADSSSSSSPSNINKMANDDQKNETTTVSSSSNNDTIDKK